MADTFGNKPHIQVIIESYDSIFLPVNMIIQLAVTKKLVV